MSKGLEEEETGLNKFARVPLHIALLVLIDSEAPADRSVDDQIP